MHHWHDRMTYVDLAGRRKVRQYLLAALALLGVAVAVLGWAQFQRYQAQAEVLATPRPLAANNPESPAVPPVPPPLLSGSGPVPASDGCPSEAESWAFQDAFPNSNYKRIEPACVYTGLAKSVAWHMLERLGYSKPEAAQLLGFDDLPWQPARQVMGLTSTQGPKAIPLVVEWAAHPDYRYWAVDSEGNPGVVYSLRGCYRTLAIVGNEVDQWGEYPVMCVVAYDRAPGWVVNELGGQHFSLDLRNQAPWRSLALFGYTGEIWVLLGEPRDQQLSMEGAGDLSQEREHTSEKFGLSVWGAAWLEATFDVGMRPLPEGWQGFAADAQAIQTIAKEIDQALRSPGVAP